MSRLVHAWSDASCSIDSAGYPVDLNFAKHSVDLAAFNQKCIWYRSRLEENSKAVLMHFPDQEAYKAWDGVDLIPSRHFEFFLPNAYLVQHIQHFKLWIKGVNGPKHQGDAVVEHCEMVNVDGSTITSQRIGPFTSTGGYDYWQLAIRDYLKLDSVIERYPEGIDVDFNFARALFPNHTVVGLPPVHLHHVNTWLKGGSKGKDFFLPFSAFIPQTGDNMCQPEDGLDCLLDDQYPEGFIKRITARMDLNAELNDVRPKSSMPMTWWLQGGLQYRPRNNQRTVVHSMLSLQNSVSGNIFTNQNLEFMSFPVVQDSFVWTKFEMPEDGQLLKAKPHSHPFDLKYGFLFRAEPSDLGLDKFVLGQSPSGCGLYGSINVDDSRCLPASLQESGFTSFDDLRKSLLRNLGRSRSRNIARGFEPPELVCETWAKLEIIGGYGYDRRTPSCCKRSSWRRGQVFTSVWLFSRPASPPGPWTEDIPEAYPQHGHWYLSFAGANSSDSSGSRWWIPSKISSSAGVPADAWLHRFSSPHLSAFQHGPGPRFEEALGFLKDTVLLPRALERVNLSEDRKVQAPWLAGLVQVSQRMPQMSMGSMMVFSNQLGSLICFLILGRCHGALSGRALLLLHLFLFCSLLVNTSDTLLRMESDNATTVAMWSVFFVLIAAICIQWSIPTDKTRGQLVRVVCPPLNFPVSSISSIATKTYSSCE